MVKSGSNIILIGFMGSGKTSVGKKLAKRMVYKFYDTDRLIEADEDNTISDIFKLHGEEYFRKLETELLLKLGTTLKGAVLSTGGGMPVRVVNRNLLKNLGCVVYLKSSKETTVKRLKDDVIRPLLKTSDLDEKVGQLLKVRMPIYKDMADIIIDTDNKTLDEIVNIISQKD